VRLIQLAKIYDDGQLGLSVQSTWLSRLHAGSVSAAFAVLMADDYFFRPLLSQALYFHLLQMAPRIANSQRIDIGSPLNHQQNLRVFSGYHSLLGYWNRLSSDPPEFPEADGCRSHTCCLKAWKSAWARVIREEHPTPPVDIIPRLQFVADRLGDNLIMGAAMSDRCRNSAMKVLLTLKKGILENMHHYFDL
jgi:hypothetical protein